MTYSNTFNDFPGKNVQIGKTRRVCPRQKVSISLARLNLQYSSEMENAKPRIPSATKRTHVETNYVPGTRHICVD